MTTEEINSINVYDYTLPTELIAQYPPSQRADSRLLCLNSNDGNIYDHKFQDLPNLLRPGDLLIFNDTKVLPARLQAHKPSGAKVEILIERLQTSNSALAHLRANRTCKPGIRLLLDDATEIEVLERDGDLFRIQAVIDFTQLMQRHGSIPLPPYINRQAESLDVARYQTVYAKYDGAVAAPTAGLHFDTAMLQVLEAMGINFAHVTLHVGAGTFQPIRTSNVAAHVMHSEWCEVNLATCNLIQQTRERGGQVIAVGTTSVRSLETAAHCGSLQPYSGYTRLFIRPGYNFRVIDGLITNFHLPRSTLLMLVCAVGGLAAVLAAYRHAIVNEYRFFSYGDAMFINKRLCK